MRKSPENLTGRQKLKLADIKTVNGPLAAYFLKEQLRACYRVPREHVEAMLDAWLCWARRSRLASFVKTISDQRAGILAAIKHGLANARVDRVEAINIQIRMLTRRAFGFHSPDALIALSMLCLSGLCPPLPR